MLYINTDDLHSPLWLYDSVDMSGNWIYYSVFKKKKKAVNFLCEFLGLITKLLKVTISYGMSVCLSVHLSTWNNSAPTRQKSIFQKPVETIQVWLKSDKNNRYFTWTHMSFYDTASLTSSWNEKCFRHIEKIKTHFLHSIIFSENWDVYEIM